MSSSQPYLAVLFTCLISTAYFGMFRIGELANSIHTIKANDVQIAKNKRKIRFILHSSKTHAKYASPQIIKISNNAVSNVKQEHNQKPINALSCPINFSENMFM